MSPLHSSAPRTWQNALDAEVRLRFDATHPIWDSQFGHRYRRRLLYREKRAPLPAYDTLSKIRAGAYIFASSSDRMSASPGYARACSPATPRFRKTPQHLDPETVVPSKDVAESGDQCAVDARPPIPGCRSGAWHVGVHDRSMRAARRCDQGLARRPDRSAEHQNILRQKPTGVAREKWESISFLPYSRRGEE